MSQTSTYGLGILGFGTVGTGIFELIQSNNALMAMRRGVRFDIVSVGIRDLSKSRAISAEKLTDDLESVVRHPDVQIVLEVMGGIEPAKSLIELSLSLGKPVVTANKELIAKHGKELLELAKSQGTELRFEAAVAGGIPVISAIERELGANRVQKITGIINGTTNYILTRMADEKLDFETVLADAQALGYAEADPSSDVDGWDAAYKLAILASVSTNRHFPIETIRPKGIRSVTSQDIQAAASLHCRVKLLATAWLSDESASARVEPVFVMSGHRLYDVNGPFNGVIVDASPVDQLAFIGRGAGGGPTGSSVMGDAVEIAVALSRGERRIPHVWHDAGKTSRKLPGPASYAIIIADDSPTAAERAEKLLTPVQIVNTAKSVGETVLVTEAVDEDLLNIALDRAGRTVRAAYRIER